LESKLETKKYKPFREKRER